MKRYIGLLLIILSLDSSAGNAPLVYAPGGLDDRFGESGSDAPFAIYDPNAPSSMRYQQVYAASLFASGVPSGGWINGISFRADDNTRHVWGGTLPDIEIALSTTRGLPDALSPVFANNLGQDNLVVFARGSVSVEMYSGSGPAGATTFFIKLQSPFFFDPAKGNLLLDVKNYTAVDLQNGGDVGPMLDAVDQVGDGVSRVFARDVKAATAATADSLGLVSRFNFLAIPEPSQGSIVLLASAGLLMIGLNRPKKSPLHAKAMRWIFEL